MTDDVYLTSTPTPPSPRPHAPRVLFLGVPLLHILSERELRGVLAMSSATTGAATRASALDLPYPRDDRPHRSGSLSDEEDEEGLDRRGSPGSRSSGTPGGSCGSPPRSPAGRSSPPTSAPSPALAAQRTPPSWSGPRVRPGVRRLLGGRGRPVARTSPARRSRAGFSASSRTSALAEAADPHLAGDLTRESRPTPTTPIRLCPSGSRPSGASRLARPDARRAPSTLHGDPPRPSCAQLQVPVRRGDRASCPS